jgi:predicted ATPase
LKSGEAEEAIVQIGSGLAASQALGSQMRHSYFLTLLAEAYIHAGRHDQSLSTVDQALGFVHESGERWWEAECIGFGEVLLTRRARDRADAEQCFQHAIRVARRQTARSLELRAAMSQARLWADDGRRTAAQNLLAPVYGWSTEGFDTADPQEGQGAARRAGVGGDHSGRLVLVDTSSRKASECRKSPYRTESFDPSLLRLIAALSNPRPSGSL